MYRVLVVYFRVFRVVRDGSISNVQIGLYVVGIIATVLVTREMSKLATRALQEAGVVEKKTN